jgi:hypothetical protein
MAPLQRDQVFQLRMTAEEKDMLTALAEHEGLAAADKIRLWIRREYASVFGAGPAARSRHKSKKK